MRSKNFDGMVCSIAGVLDALGDRWAVLILRDISLGLKRYEDFRQSTDITNATLSDRLRHLEAHKLIERRPYQTNPLRHEYVMTPKGRDTILVLMAMAQVPGPAARSSIVWPFRSRTTSSACTSMAFPWDIDVSMFAVKQ